MSRRHFEAELVSAREARRFVAAELGGRTDPDLLDRMLLVVSELATNAVRHAASDFDVDVHSDGVVRVVVSDESPELPTPRQPEATDTSGRGMVILEHCCSRWGAERSSDGKQVWCEMDRTSSQP